MVEVEHDCTMAGVVHFIRNHCDQHLITVCTKDKKKQLKIASNTVPG